MSIEYSPSLDRFTSSLPENAATRGALKQAPPSQRRIDANRRNARKSTGPRTIEGKRTVASNALKHGLCTSTAVPSCEDLPTFNMFADELRKELNPQTVVQKILFPQIAQLAWNLRRFPEAQAAMFQRERDEEPGSESMTASELLARRFSAEPSNGFALLGRYERANQAMFLRLLNQFHKVGKAAANTKPDSEERVPREYVPAISPVQMVQQEMDFHRRVDEREQYIPPRNEREAHIDGALDAMATQKKQSQNRQAKNSDSSEKEAISEVSRAAPVTKQTQSPSHSPLASPVPASLDSEPLASIHSQKEQS